MYFKFLQRICGAKEPPGAEDAFNQRFPEKEGDFSMAASAEKPAASGGDLGSGSVPKLLFKLALPAVVAQVINLLYNIVDRIYIGHIADVGATALTGVGLFTPILMLITAFAMLCGSGGAPRAAISMGQKDNDTAEKIMGNCFCLLVILAVAVTAVFYAFAPQLLTWFGASDATLPYALAYTRIYVLGSIFVMIVLGINPFITTQGFATFSMATTLIGAVCNIILDPILIFALDMGVQGAAIATVISQAISACWVLLFLTGKRTHLHLRLKNFRLRRRIILPCLALGVSTFVMLATESLLSICFNSSLSGYGGDLAVGAMTIMTSTMQLVQMPLQGICQGGQPILSYNFGAGKSDRVKQAFRCQFTVCVIYAAAFWALVMLLPTVFTSLFTSDAELVEYAAWAMRIYMAGAFAHGFQLSCQQSFVALGQAKVSLFMACLRKLILLIPLIYLLPALLPDNQVFAVFLAEPISDILAATVTTVTFFVRFNGILERGPQGRRSAPADSAQ